MLEGFPGCVRVNPVVDLLVVRKVEVAEGLHGTEGRGLRAKIRAADIDRLNAVADSGVDLLKILEGNLALVLKNFVNVVLAAAGGDVPFRNIANAFRVLEGRRRDDCDIAKRGAAEVANNASARRSGLMRGTNQGVDIFLRDEAELLHIVFRVQLLFVDRLLADNAIEEITSARHAPAGWDAGVALRIDQSITILINRGIKVSGNQHFKTVELPALPALGRNSPLGGAATDSNAVAAHRIQQVFVYLPQHLRRFENAHWVLLKSVVVAQGRHATDVHAGNVGSTEVDRDR